MLGLVRSGWVWRALTFLVCEDGGRGSHHISSDRGPSLGPGQRLSNEELIIPSSEAFTRLEGRSPGKQAFVEELGSLTRVLES